MILNDREGEFSNLEAFFVLCVQASSLPLSIIIIGMGTGNFDGMYD